MSAALQLAPGIEAPARVTVRGQGWRVPGRVTGRAPYSVHVTYASPQGERAGWFVWEPGKGTHGHLHGGQAEAAEWIEAG